MEKIWDLLKTSCLEFTLPDPNDPSKQSGGPGEASAFSSDMPDGMKKDSENPLAASNNKEAGASKEAKKG